MITRTQFDAMQLNERGQYLLAHGKQLSTREDHPTLGCTVFKLHDFFVEVVYNKEPLEIIEIREYVITWENQFRYYKTDWWRGKPSEIQMNEELIMYDTN